MKKYRIIFDASLIARGYHSGIYFVSREAMLAILRDPRFQTCLVFDPLRVRPEDLKNFSAELETWDIPRKPQMVVPAMMDTCWKEFYLNISDKINRLTASFTGKLLAIPLRALRKIFYLLLQMRWLPSVQEFVADCWFSPVYAPNPAMRYIPRKMESIILHDTIPLDFPQLHTLEWKNPTWWYARMFNSLNSNGVYFSNSEYTKQSFLRYAPHLKPDRISTALLAADPQKFYCCNDSGKIRVTLEKYHIPAGSRYLFSLATLEERKNLLFVVESFVELVEEKKVSGLYLVLGGGLYAPNDPRQQQVQQKIQEYAERCPFIRLIGYVADEDLAPLYSGAEAFVYPSLFEGFGLPVLEAMQCGTAVITSNVSSMPEVAGDAALMIRPDQKEEMKKAILKLHNDDEFRAALAAKGLKRAGQFSWHKFADKICNDLAAQMEKHPALPRRKKQSAKARMVFNATILAEGYHSGLYNAAKNILMELIKSEKFRIRLWFFPTIPQEKIDRLYQDLPQLKKLEAWAEYSGYTHFPQLVFYREAENWLNRKIDAGFRAGGWKFYVVQCLRAFRKISHYQVRYYSACEQAFKTDFYQCCDVFFDPLFAPRGAFLKNPRLLRYTLLYDTIPHSLASLFTPEKRHSGWYAQVLDSFHDNVCHYFSISASTKRDFLKFAPGAKPEMIDTALLAADRSVFHPVRGRIRLLQLKKRYHIPADGRYIFSLCSLEVHKNLLPTVKAFLKMIENDGSFKDYYLVLGGGTATGNQQVREQLLNYEKEAGGRIIITGYLPENDLPVLYSNAECFVFNSLYEGFGLPLLEAMQCGCPVITNRGSSLAEVAGDVGCYVSCDSVEELRDAMTRLCSDPALRRQYSNAVLAYSCNFSWKRTADIIIDKILRDLHYQLAPVPVPVPDVPDAILPKIAKKLFRMPVDVPKVPAVPAMPFLRQIREYTGIDKNALDEYMKAHPVAPLCPSHKKNGRLIVSLTSFPQRCYDIHYALDSIFRQTLRPDKIVLWLGEEKFPNREKDLPDTLLALIEKGLEIRWVKEDLRAFTKLFYSLQDFPEDVIVTVDDDIYYQPDWLEKLYAGYRKAGKPAVPFASRPHFVAADGNGIQPYKKWPKETGTKSASHRNFVTGVGGMLYPPRCMDPEVMNIAEAKKLTPLNDDIWFYLMAVKKRKGVFFARESAHKLIFVNLERELRISGEETLAMQNVVVGGNDVFIQNVIQKYPYLLNLIFEGTPED